MGYGRANLKVFRIRVIRFGGLPWSDVLMAGLPSLAVWAVNRLSGLLARETHRNYLITYDPDADTYAQVSPTMPVRLESWVSREMHPISQMNLP